jgi:hypothetical protein
VKSLPSRLLRASLHSLDLLAIRGLQKLLRAYCFPLTGIPYGLTTRHWKLTFKKSSNLTLHCPLNNEALVHPFFKNLKKKQVWASSPEGVCTLKKGYSTLSGGNLTEDGKLLTTYLKPTDGKPFHEHPLFHFKWKKLNPKILKVDEPVISLTAGWSGAFYHWMYQVLPRLGLVKNNKALIYVDQSHDFQRQSLALLGLSDRVIDASVHPTIWTPELIIPRILEAPTLRSVHFLKDSFITTAQPAHLRLYIAREDAKTRRLMPASELEALLSSYGYIKINLSTLKLKEQIELFQQAESVLAPHGAGLSHLAFCHPQTAVIECFHTQYFNPCYWQLCQAASLRYFAFFDTSASASHDPDINIDLQALEKLLNQLHFKKRL